tara:strand:+ start:14083 stop:16101 length:2019 start_codon:yes stop_codon:yes gene_type:complete
MSKYKRHLVTAALIYANGPIHIGHLAGCYIPSDIYVRFLRSKGEDVKFISGTDEHGVPITFKARDEKTTPKKIVDYYYKKIDESFKSFGISFDIFSRTSNQEHHKTSSDFFLNLYNKNSFDEISSSQYYDEVENQFLSDRYISGECPSCKYQEAYGDQCEKCGKTLSPLDLKNPKSKLSGNKPVLKETKNWYLPMDKLQSKIEKYIESNKDWKTNVIGQCKSWLKEGLKPRAMTRDLDWGVKVPLKDANGKVLYVWFDAPIGYITATKELENNDWEKYWKNKNTKLVHFIGKDNIVFHCIIFPMMLMEHGNYILPANVPANEFMNLEGKKISTSRNWAVWLHEYLVDFPDMQDVLRYCLITNLPESKDSDFTWKDFQAKNNNELVAIFGNYINRVMVLTHKYFNGVVPDNVNPNQLDKEIFDKINIIKLKIETSIDNYRFRKAMSLVIDLSRLGNKYLADTEPWKIIKEDKDRVKSILYNSIQLVANIAILCEPLLPFTSLKILKILNMKYKSWIDVSDNLIKSGHHLGESSHIFSKIEDAEIDNQIEKLKLTTTKKNKIMELKETIEFDDFSKIDLRLATIIEAENVPKSEKLIKLTVDTGVDKRIILSGISKYYKPKDLINKQVMILINLKPRVMMGIESQGMLLLAENPDGSLRLMHPDNEAINGSIIA